MGKASCGVLAHGATWHVLEWRGPRVGAFSQLLLEERGGKPRGGMALADDVQEDVSEELDLHGVLEEVPRIRGPPALRHLVLMMGHLGTHFAWAVQNARASLFLQRLGLSSSVTALVLMAGPLSGLLVQPIVGVLSDHCTSRLGRRRPYLLVGCAVCMVSLSCMSAGSTISRIHGGKPNALATLLGVLSIVGTDVSLNVLSAAHRALVTDILPAHEQSIGNAWGSRLGGLGSVLGYLFGETDLPAQLPTLSGAFQLDQLALLALLAAVLLLLTHASLFLLVRESRLVSGDVHGVRRLMRVPWELLATASVLPRAILDLFAIQFAAWLAWFPVLFFSVSWVANIYRAAHGDSGGSSATSDRAGDEARRVGSYAMFCYACTSLVSSVVLPWLVQDGTHDGRSAHKPRRVRCFDTPYLRWLRAPTLAEAWCASHVLFGTVLLFGTCPTYSMHSVAGAILLLSVLGVSWTLTNWAPFTLLSLMLYTTHDSGTAAEDEVPLAPLHQTTASTQHTAHGTDLLPHTGAVLGLHNWSIVVPQMVVSLVSSAGVYPSRRSRGPD